jgi:DNA uptake protein ComE-like DNA-binding protein
LETVHQHTHNADESKRVLLCHVDFSDVMREVRTKLMSRYGETQLTPDERLQIVAHAVLGKTVSASAYVVEQGRTWRHLAELGLFSLSVDPVTPTLSYVRMPFIWLWIHLLTLAASHKHSPAFAPWREFTGPQASEADGGAGFLWQSYESLTARTLALRMNMFKALGYTKVTLGELLGGGCVGASSVEVPVPADYMPSFVLGSASGRFPETNAKGLVSELGEPIEWKTHALTVKNVDGAAFDGFLSAPVASLLGLVQCKHSRVGGNEVTDAILHDEEKKCRQAITAAQLDWKWVLIVVSSTDTKVTTAPSNCIVIKDHLSFFGPVLSSRAQLAASQSSRVNVNTAADKQLMLCAGVGAAIAKSVLQERQVRSFSDWADLKSRVPRFPTSLHPCVCFA